MLMVDTSQLVFGEKDRIDIKASIKKLCDEIDILQLHKLAGFEGSLHFDETSDIITNRALYEKMQKYLSQHEEELIELLNDPIIKNWVASIDQSALAKVRLAKCIIASQRSRDTLVEIHTEQVLPSKAASAETDSFVNHIVRNIKTQISEKQLQPKGFNIIVVNGFNWILFPFEADKLRPLSDTLHKFFEEARQPYLSGVAVFVETIDKGIYISNPYAKKSSTLEKADVTKLGFNWLKF
jgi:dihydroneopterin aldolase